MLGHRQRRQVSDSLAGFTDLSELASDGPATTYRAIEVDTGRPVKLQALQTAQLPTYAAVSLDRDLRVLGLISAHPNIVTLYRRTAMTDGRPVLVMEMCRESLAERLRRLRRLEPHAAVSIAVKVAGALQTAHVSGLLHREVAPENVQLTEFEEPALDGLGLASLSAVNGPGSRPSAQHAPPEVLEGGELSAASDVYSLASTLYQLLTGKAPFTAFDGEPQAAVILRILTDPAPVLTDADIPVVLADLIDWAMSKDPAARPATPVALAEELRSVERAHGWELTPLVVPHPETRPVRPETRRPSTTLLSPPAGAESERWQPAGSGPPAFKLAGQAERSLEPEEESPEIWAPKRHRAPQPAETAQRATDAWAPVPPPAPPSPPPPPRPVVTPLSPTLDRRSSLLEPVSRGRSVASPVGPDDRPPPWEPPRRPTPAAPDAGPDTAPGTDEGFVPAVAPPPPPPAVTGVPSPTAGFEARSAPGPGVAPRPEAETRPGPSTTSPPEAGDEGQPPAAPPPRRGLWWQAEDED